ncbi:serine hydrolase [Flavobacterium sp. HSC-61S13]|uniref:serine hydrolase domain-containing protein n=1 Tax=Flavobacterium sp. HSC-61S13 TaxID=2910963 RepID=UPI0020A18B09|nr:serine hydrolase domain-containing protein [Flavobacterium sp. HSC-61S13]MCP1996820.1 CubicO group peptidase (beta-lactamase class C family) [Flavobacterium sp. HSC-61S13]
MKYIYSSLLAATLILASCNKNKDLAERIPADSELHITENPYEVQFNELDPEYILKQNHIVEEFYHKNINKNDYSGGFLVAKNGKILFEEYSGYSNRAKNEMIGQNTPMHVASVGKVVTSIATLRLVNDGLLDLDQSVVSVLPSFPYPQTTIRMLLNHRSGLKYYGYFTAEKNIWNTTQTITNQDVLDIISSGKVALDFKPNSKFTYSNTNYVLLALIVEKISGKPYKKALKDLILDPLEMTHTFVFDDINKKDEVCQSYDGNYRLMRFDYLDGTYGDKNIYTTPRDLLKLDKAMYSDVFLNKDLKDQMYKGYSYERKGKNNYGLGMRLIEMNNGKNYTFHNGWWRGNTSSYIRLQQDTVSIILLSNKYSKLTYKTIDLAHHFGDYSVGNLEN